MTKEIKKDRFDTDTLQNEEINLSELTSIIWFGKWNIVVITMFFSAIATIYAVMYINLKHYFRLLNQKVMEACLL